MACQGSSVASGNTTTTSIGPLSIGFSDNFTRPFSYIPLTAFIATPRLRFTAHSTSNSCYCLALLKQGLQTNLRPRFESRKVGEQFAKRPKSRVDDLAFARLDRGAVNVHQMHDA